MKKRSGCTVIELLICIAMILAVLILPLGWGLNLYKLCGLDFKAPYKAEAIRVIGVFTPIGGIVGYLELKDE